jgi:hypothetical protein
MDAESLYSCGFAGLSGFDSAQLREAAFGRLLPVCCPEWMSVFGRPGRCEDPLREDHSGAMNELLQLLPSALRREDCECVVVPSGAVVRLVPVLFARDSARG